MDEANKLKYSGFPDYKNLADYYRDYNSDVLGVMEKLGLKNPQKYNMQETQKFFQLKDMFENGDYMEDKIIVFTTRRNLKTREGYEFAPNHAYQIKAFKDNSGNLEYRAINSSDTSCSDKISLEDILTLGSSSIFYVAEV